jgi:hypothetical protein
MVQTAEDRRGDDVRLFGEAVTGGHELIRVGQGLWNARSQAGVWTASIVVSLGPKPVRRVRGESSVHPARPAHGANQPTWLGDLRYNVH